MAPELAAEALVCACRVAGATRRGGRELDEEELLSRWGVGADPLSHGARRLPPAAAATAPRGPSSALALRPALARETSSDLVPKKTGSDPGSELVRETDSDLVRDASSTHGSQQIA